jgi:hypothetical protein
VLEFSGSTKESWSKSTQYTIKIPAGVKSVFRDALTKEYTYQFDTALMTLVDHVVHNPMSVDPCIFYKILS